MPLPIVPIAAAAVFGAVVIAKSKRAQPPMSQSVEASRRTIYVDAMTSRSVKPDYLRGLAQQFAQQGMTAEAEMLVKRAELAEAPKELKEARKEALRAAFASKNPDAVRRFADLHEQMGALGAAAGLREYASGLEETQDAPPQNLPNDGGGV